MSKMSNADLERRVRLKLDFILLPFLSLLFLFNSLDKSNIGSAETGHFTEDAGLDPEALNTSVACFFAAFVALQPVGAAFGRRFGMARYVPFCMALWGLLTAAHALVHQEWQLIALRTAVGALEAGFYPTTVSYLSLFYTRFEFAKRLGIFYGQAALAGAFGGLLSYVVFKHFPTIPEAGVDNVVGHSTSGWRSWQVLFVIEGFATMIIALIGFVWLPHSVDTAWFLSVEERRCAERRICNDRGQSSLLPRRHSQDRGASPISSNLRFSESSADGELDPRSSFGEDAGLLSDDSASSRSLKHMSSSAYSLTNGKGLDIADIVAAVSDWKVWYLLACNIFSALPVTAFSVFLPMVVKRLAGSTSDDDNSDGQGMSPARANLLTVPPFFAGAVILWLFTAWSDRTRQRLAPILLGLLILIAGLTATIMLPEGAHKARYFALIVLLSGSFVPSPLTVAWLTNNMPEPGKRAIVLGINGWGNLAGVLSAMLFSPRYREGGYIMPFWVTLACVVASFIGFVVFRTLLVGINGKRAAIVSHWDENAREREAAHGDAVAPGYGSRRNRIGEERITFQFGL